MTFGIHTFRGQCTIAVLFGIVIVLACLRNSVNIIPFYYPMYIPRCIVRAGPRPLNAASRYITGHQVKPQSSQEINPILIPETM